MKIRLLLVLSILLTQTSELFSLSTGDVVIIGMKTDGTDEYSWVPLVDLPAGELLYFTDAGYFASPTGSDEYNSSSTTEWLLQFTTPTGGITAGTVQTVTSGSISSDYLIFSNTKFGDRTTGSPLTFSITSSGDQVMVFQSTDDPTLTTFGNVNFTPLFAISSQCTEWSTNTDGDGNQSDIHPGLTDGTNAVAHGVSSTIEDEYDNIRYTGIVNGSQATILAAVADDANWEGDQAVITSGWSENGVSKFTGLPVELMYFKGAISGRLIELTWQTASELNNEKFELETSENGSVFYKIGEVKGAGTSIEVQEYFFTVENPLNGIHYYRLRQVDYDGRFENSDVISVNFKNENRNVGEFYPNPSKSGLVKLNYTSQNTDEVTITLFDMDGKLITVHPFFEGNNKLSIDFSGLNEGLYIVKIGSERDFMYRKLIIQ